jgi:hypothetical protein
MTDAQLKVLDEAELVLGNLILQLGFEPECKEYRAWIKLLELIEKEKQ